MGTELRIIGIALGAMSLAACATVTRGDHTAWEVNTTPPGARVTTSNGYSCDSTPCSIRMPRKSEFSASITKAGYTTLQVSVTTKVATSGGVAMAGNVLLGGVVGAGVDLATGAMLDLTPNPVNVTLEKDDVPPAPPPPPVAQPAVSAVPAAPPPPSAPVPAPG